MSVGEIWLDPGDEFSFDPTPSPTEHIVWPAGLLNAYTRYVAAARPQAGSQHDLDQNAIDDPAHNWEE